MLTPLKIWRGQRTLDGPSSRHGRSMWASMMRRTNSATEMSRRLASFFKNFNWGSVNEIICFVTLRVLAFRRWDLRCRATATVTTRLTVVAEVVRMSAFGDIALDVFASSFRQASIARLCAVVSSIFGATPRTSSKGEIPLVTGEEGHIGRDAAPRAVVVVRGDVGVTAPFIVSPTIRKAPATVAPHTTLFLRVKGIFLHTLSIPQGISACGAA